MGCDWFEIPFFSVVQVMQVGHQELLLEAIETLAALVRISDFLFISRQQSSKARLSIKTSQLILTESNYVLYYPMQAPTPG